MDVSQVVAGQTAALALKKVKRAAVRKGMVLVDERLHPKASWEFDADIAILTHSTTIQPRYQVRHWILCASSRSSCHDEFAPPGGTPTDSCLRRKEIVRNLYNSIDGHL